MIIRFVVEMEDGDTALTPTTLRFIQVQVTELSNEPERRAGTREQELQGTLLIRYPCTDQQDHEADCARLNERTNVRPE